jgi:multicomponent Na+:H+ antiporter subunit G
LSVLETISAILMILGALFMLVGGLGVLRLPDLYMRVSAATKASTLGVGFSLLALAVHFHDLGIASRALATIAFVTITAPVAAHLISRSAYFVGVPLWKGTIADELRGRYNPSTDTLQSLPLDSTLGEPTDLETGEDNQNQ